MLAAPVKALDPGEDCDGSELNDQTCEGLGYYEVLGTLRCNADCTFDRSGAGCR